MICVDVTGWSWSFCWYLVHLSPNRTNIHQLWPHVLWVESVIWRNAGICRWCIYFWLEMSQCNYDSSNEYRRIDCILMEVKTRSSVGQQTWMYKLYIEDTNPIPRISRSRSGCQNVKTICGGGKISPAVNRKSVFFLLVPTDVLIW